MALTFFSPPTINDKIKIKRKTIKPDYKFFLSVVNPNPLQNFILKLPDKALLQKRCKGNHLIR